LLQEFIEGAGRQGGAFCGVLFNSVFKVGTGLDPNRLEEYERWVGKMDAPPPRKLEFTVLSHAGSPIYACYPSSSRDRIWTIASSPLPGVPVQTYRSGPPGIGGQEEPYYDVDLFYIEDYASIVQGSVYQGTWRGQKGWWWSY
jgi:hypothetical protein